MFICNKTYRRKLDENLKKWSFNTCKFSNHDISNFNHDIIVQKGVYSYEYMDDWENSNETLLPKKQDYYSNLNMEDITETDYAYKKELVKILK